MGRRWRHGGISLDQSRCDLRWVFVTLWKHGGDSSDEAFLTICERFLSLTFSSGLHMLRKPAEMYATTPESYAAHPVPR